MTSMTDQPRPVTGGVDTHLHLHVAAAVCAVTGRLLGTAAFSAEPCGYRALVAWLDSFGDLDRVGIEGTGSYGAGLARHMAGRGITVVEVSRPDRKTRRDRGKADAIDAEAAARAVLAGTARAVPKTHDGPVEAIRALHLVYRSATKERTRAINQFKALVVTAPDQIRSALAPLPLNDQVAKARRWPDTHRDPLQREIRAALRELARRISELTAQRQRMEARLRPLVEQAAPAVLDIVGVGVHTAARLLIAAGDNPQRMRSQAAFANLCGVAPLPASSGRTVRHRLNRGGDRSANHALWRIAMVRLTTDPRTRAYAARRKAEGLSDKEIMRCLKRYIAREVHRALTGKIPPAPRGPELRRLRVQLGLTLRDVCEHLGGHITRLSEIERGRRVDAPLQHRVHAWLTEQTTLAQAA